MMECPLYEVKRSTHHIIDPRPSAPIEKVLEESPGRKIIKGTMNKPYFKITG